MQAFAQDTTGGQQDQGTGGGMGAEGMGPGGMGPGAMDPGTSIAITLIFSALLVYPFWRVYRRAGLNPWYSLLVFLPYVGLPAAAAILAFQRWPHGESVRAAKGVFAPKSSGTGER
jgi:hypothetical protein